MHFFIDHTKLSGSQPASYGPINNNEYLTTAKFVLTASARAFAVVDGLVVLYPSSGGTDIVNMILKPQKSIEINFTPVKYFVYRGLKKDSFLNPDPEITPQASTNSKLIEEVWKEFNNWKSIHNPNAPPPEGYLIGYDTTNIHDSNKIDELFANLHNARPFPVKEGWWIGDFKDTINIGFDIVLEEGDVVKEFNYLKKTENIIDVSTYSGFEYKIKKEEILNFIDPAAFFGMQYLKGIDVTFFDAGTWKKEERKENDLFNDIVDKFETRNRLYLDIRNDIGYSFNFYQNYDISGKQLKLGNSLTSPVAIEYKASSSLNWPIMFIEIPMNVPDNKNNIKIGLPIVTNNKKPLLYIVHAEQAISTTTTRFIGGTNLAPIGSTDWTRIITFSFPNHGTAPDKFNVAWYIKLHYCRQFDLTNNWPLNVLKTDKYTDNIFGPINIDRLGKPEDPSKFLYNQDIKYITGKLPCPPPPAIQTKEFGFIAERGVVFEDDDGVSNNDKIVFFC
jgi:hypothetical protein